MSRDVVTVPEVGQGWALIRNRCFSHTDFVREVALSKEHEIVQPSFSFCGSVDSFTTTANYMSDHEFPDASWIYIPSEHEKQEVALHVVDLYKVVDLLSEESFEELAASPREKEKINKIIKLGNYHRIRLNGAQESSKALKELHELCETLYKEVVIYSGTLLIKDNNRIALRVGVGKTEYLREAWTRILR